MYIIIKKHHQDYAGSVNPVVHDTEKLARIECSRLARRNPKEQFIIMKAICSMKAVTQVVETVVGITVEEIANA